MNPDVLLHKNALVWIYPLDEPIPMKELEARFRETFFPGPDEEKAEQDEAYSHAIWVEHFLSYSEWIDQNGSLTTIED